MAEEKVEVKPNVGTRFDLKDLNPDYTEESKDNQEALPPTDNI